MSRCGALQIGWSVVLAVLAMGTPASIGAPRSPDQPAAVRIEIAGPEQKAFRWSAQHCNPTLLPDAGARAIRDAAGMVHLFATHHNNWESIGRTLDDVVPDCKVVFHGQGSDDPSLFSDHSWIAAPYTPDGKSVYALVHNEFQGHLRPWLCPSRKYADCWYNTVTLAVSQDGGRTFSAAPPPAQLVAAVPYPYDPAAHQNVGYFNPTNIVQRDSHYYTMVFARQYRDQKYGSCLLRTDDLSRADSWRGWDGAGFSVRFVDPYRAHIDRAANHVCEPVGAGHLNWPVHSLVWSERAHSYIALMNGQVLDPATKRPVRGVVASTSPDLIAWSTPTLVMPASHPVTYQCGDADPINYPSLLDPASTSRNFETVGDRAYLYFTRWNTTNCRKTLDRDLVRVPVRILVPSG